MKMCHMIADSTEELLEMAHKLGLQSKWLQFPGTYKEHFDICKSKRESAIFYGATPLTQTELARKLAMRPKD